MLALLMCQLMSGIIDESDVIKAACFEILERVGEAYVRDHEEELKYSNLISSFIMTHQFDFHATTYFHHGKWLPEDFHSLRNLLKLLDSATCFLS